MEAVWVRRHFWVWKGKTGEGQAREGVEPAEASSFGYYMKVQHGTS